MKAIDGYNKRRGGYYTPGDIADFIVKWAVKRPDSSILEPGCGDGRFLSAVKDRLSEFGDTSGNIVTGVELDPVEAKKAGQYDFNVITGDFFT